VFPSTRPATTALLALLVLAACGRQGAPVGAARGGARSENPTPEHLKPGRWAPAPAGAPAAGLSADQLAEIERLNAIGYASGVRTAPDVRSVTVHDPDRAYRGLNLYVSGHGSEALLLDMEGTVLHRWSYDYGKLWPQLEVPEDAPGRGKWRRAYVYPNGDLLAIHEAIGLIKLDRRSRLLWEYPGRAHHDLEMLDDGTIWVLTRAVGIIPRIDPDQPSVEEFMVHLDADGREIERVSLLESLERAGASELLERMPESGILLHTNSIERLDGRLAARVPELGAGRFLVSFRALDAIGAIDVEAGELVWSLTGSFVAQHHATVLDRGTILLFDNRGPGDDASAVTELDPLSGAIVWEYRGSEDRPFFSGCCGTAYRLPNGNTLITETDGGRAFEVTEAGETVWEFYNPHRAGEQLEYIASIYDLQRLPAELGREWLGR
jgi:hypothetical protein